MGKLSSITDASGTIGYSYDAENRLASVTQTINLPQTDDNGVSQYTSTISYAYDDPTGRLTRITSNSNDTLYGYDELGRLTSVTALTLGGKTWGGLNS